MNKDKLTEFLRQKSIVIPLNCFRLYKKMHLTLLEFIFLMYLKDKGEKFPFNPQEMMEELGIDQVTAMELVASLSEKKLLVVSAYKNDKNIMEEEVCLKDFYDKYTFLLMEQMTQNNGEKVIDNSEIFTRIEREFGRTLSPSEVEFIKAWLNNFKEELILEAVKEAILNGVSSIRYIDKILYEWDKKGIKTKEEVKHLLHNQKKESKEPLEVFDYDWFEEDNDFD